MNSGNDSGPGHTISGPGVGGTTVFQITTPGQEATFYVPGKQNKYYSREDSRYKPFWGFFKIGNSKYLRTNFNLIVLNNKVETIQKDNNNDR